MSLSVVEAGTADFEVTVIRESHHRPVAVDFWAPWCGPCRLVGPVLEKLAAEFGGAFLLAKVNTEAHPQLAEAYQIRSIPNIKLFKDGAIVDEVIGALPEPQLRDFLRAHCPTPADGHFARGMELLQHGRRGESRAAFSAALESDPRHEGALLELGRMAALEDDPETASTYLQRIATASACSEEARALEELLDFRRICSESGGSDACTTRAQHDPKDLEAQYQWACCLAAEGDFRAALEVFLYIVGRDKKFRDEAPRRAMLTIFALAGKRSALSEEFRKRLALALF